MWRVRTIFFSFFVYQVQLIKRLLSESGVWCLELWNPLFVFCCTCVFIFYHRAKRLYLMSINWHDGPKKLTTNNYNELNVMEHPQTIHAWYNMMATCQDTMLCFLISNYLLFCSFSHTFDFFFRSTFFTSRCRTMMAFVVPAEQKVMRFSRFLPFFAKVFSRST